MAIAPINWDNLNQAERLALIAAGEQSPLAFTALWYNITQSDTFRTNWHHHLYNWAAEKMLSGESQNNIINIPPGGSKTEFWSIHLPVYCMVKFPRVRILNTSYSKDLVNENSDRSRALIKSSEFQQFYRMQLGKDKVDDWTILKNNKRMHQLFSRPSGGQITGVRGGFISKDFSGYITADDWDKMDDLFSDAKRRKSHTRLVNTLRSRRAHSGTPFVFIQQRGHTDDSTAFLLSGYMGLNIDTHIKIPALINMDYIKELPTKELRDRCIKDVCNHDPVNGYWSYWPLKESIEDLVALRDANPYTFTSQYQQEPESLDGGIFHEENFMFYGDEKDDSGELVADLPTPDYFEYRIIVADTAQKTKEHNDFSVFSEWGFYNGRLYRLSFLRAKMEARELRQSFESFCRKAWDSNSAKNGNLRAIYVEDKASGTGLIQEVSSRVQPGVTPVQRHVDKLTRAMDCQPHHAAGCIALPYGDPDNYEFVKEVTSFSADGSHKHDDQTDVMMDAINETIIQSNLGSSSGVYVPSRKKRRQ